MDVLAVAGEGYSWTVVAKGQLCDTGCLETQTLLVKKIHVHWPYQQTTPISCMVKPHAEKWFGYLSVLVYV